MKIMSEFLKWRKTIIAGLTVLSFVASFTLFMGINKLREEDKYFSSLIPYDLKKEKLIADTKPYELINTIIPYFEKAGAAAVSSTLPSEEGIDAAHVAEAVSDDEYIKAYLEDWRKMEAKLKPPEVFDLNNYADWTEKIKSIADKAEVIKSSLTSAEETKNLPFVCLADPCLVSTVVVYNDNTKIDCGGITLMPNAAETAGIIIKANNVTVANCGFQRFTTAIEAEGNGAIIYNNKIKNTEKGGLTLKGGSVFVFSNTFSGIKDFAVSVRRSSTQNTFYKNTFSGNESGVNVLSAQNNFVANIFENNKGALGLTAGDNFMAKNNFFGNADFGISINEANRNIIFDNTIEGNGYGIYASATQSNQIIGNRIQNNKKQGIYMEDSSFNEIVGNKILDNGSEGFWLSGLSDGNKIRLNEIKSNKSSCSLVFGELNGAKPENNTVELNETDKEQCML